MTGPYGPNTKQVEAFLALLPSLTAEQWEAVRDASDARWNALWDAAWEAAWDGAWNAHASTSAIRAAARATSALAVRDLISREHFNTLTAPMQAAGIDFDTLGGASD